MDAARNGNRRILQATRINRIHPVAPGPRRRGPLIMSTPLPGSARVTDALLTERKGAVARLRLHRPELHNAFDAALIAARSEEHTSELQSLMRNSYAVFCLKKKTNKQQTN